MLFSVFLPFCKVAKQLILVGVVVHEGNEPVARRVGSAREARRIPVLKE
jgi:hypothetical protein